MKEMYRSQIDELLLQLEHYRHQSQPKLKNLINKKQ